MATRDEMVAKVAKALQEHRVFPCDGAWFCECGNPCHPADFAKHLGEVAVDALAENGTPEYEYERNPQ